MTPQEIFQATTQNALLDACPERLDEILCHANSNLLNDNPGIARQVQSSIQSVHAEKSRRNQKDVKWIEWAILILTAASFLVVLAEKLCHLCQAP